MSNTGPPDLTVRAPAPAEVERVLHLFRNMPVRPTSQFLGAVRSRPIERFVGAAAWWPVGTTGMFQLACEPGVDRTVVAGQLIDKVAECARLAGMQTIQCANLLTDDNAWLGVLRTQGFQCCRSERSFEIAYEDAWRRVMELHHRHGSRIPAGWRTKPIRELSPETALEVIQSHHLMPPDEIRAYWKRNTPHGFTLDLSCILFDGQRAFGAFLARRMGEVYYVDVQVVRETNPRLRSLGDLYMMYRMFTLHDEAQRAGRDVPIRWLRFRCGETEHVQTANLAFRMGGRELPPQRVLAKAL